MLNNRYLTYHRNYILIVILVFIPKFFIGQNYTLLYENDFEQNQKVLDFEFSDATAWKLSETSNNKSLELFGKSNYTPRVRSPYNIAVLKSIMVGSFILEVELKQTGQEYDHRDMCLFFGMKDPANFYYVHIATASDANAHNIFIVNDEIRRNIA